MLKFRLAFVVAIVALAACAGPTRAPLAPSTIASSVSATTGKLADRSVSSPEGEFTLKDLSIGRGLGGTEIKGTVTNGTGKHVRQVEFAVSGLGASGASTGSGSFYANDLKPGESKSIPTFSVIRHDTGLSLADAKFSVKSVSLTTRYIFAMSKPAASEALTFSDDALDFKFLPTKQQIGFVLRNKAQAPAKVDWNTTAFVDTSGTSRRVMHTGVKFTERSSSMPPTIIPPGASINDMVYPSDLVTYTSGRYGGWNEAPMFPESPSASQLKGATFGVFIPIEVGGKVRNYNFVFVIKDVVVGE